MHDTEARFLERLVVDVERLVGPGIVVRDVATIDRAGGVTIAITCDTSIGPRTIESTGENLIEAAGGLLARLPEERLAVAFRQLVEEHAHAR